MIEKRLIVDEDCNIVDTMTGEGLDDNQMFDLVNELNKEKQYFLKVIFAMGNYAEKGDYERIIDARDAVRQRILND